jgi:hypothetical protein
MVANLDALAKLLSDDDPETVRLVKEQMLSNAEENIPPLEELMDSDDAVVASHAKEVFDELQGRQAREEFQLFCHLGGEVFDLEQAAWSLVRAIKPGICTHEHQVNVNEWGRRYLSGLSLCWSNRDRVNLLTDQLANGLGFSGNSATYYCEENSLLTTVIDSRRGIPITLTLLYIMIAARAAVKVEGVNLPGHFIAKLGDIYFDPFHGGRTLCQCDIEQILKQQGMEFAEKHLQVATPRQFLLRMLANLLYVYDLDGEAEKHEMVKCWMDALSGGASAK